MTEILEVDTAGGSRPVDRDTPSPLAAPAGKRTLNIGQFRLTRLQLVNWGTFDGYRTTRSTSGA